MHFFRCDADVPAAATRRSNPNGRGDPSYTRPSTRRLSSNSLSAVGVSGNGRRAQKTRARGSQPNQLERAPRNRLLDQSIPMQRSGPARCGEQARHVHPRRQEFLENAGGAVARAHGGEDVSACGLGLAGHSVLPQSSLGDPTPGRAVVSDISDPRFIGGRSFHSKRSWDHFHATSSRRLAGRACWCATDSRALESLNQHSEGGNKWQRN